MSVASPGSQDAEVTDDVNVDVGRFLSTLWNRRAVILLVTVAGALAGVAYVRLTPLVYVGRSQVTVATASGSVLAADSANLFQSALSDPEVLKRVLSDAGLQGTDPAELRQKISSRLLPPGNRMIVDVESQDPAMAASLANAATKRAFEVVRERQGSRSRASQVAIDGEAAEAEAALETATDALSTLRKSGAMDAARSAIDLHTVRRRQLQDTLTDIVTERARLAMLEERIARAGTQAAQTATTAATARNDIASVEFVALAEQRVATEIRLAGLTVLRDHLENVLKGQTRESLISAMTDVELRQTRLQTALNRAQQVRDRSADAAAVARRNAVAQPVGLELNAESEATVRPVGPTLMSGVARGSAFGFVVGVFAVFFLNGLRFSFFARRA